MYLSQVIFEFGHTATLRDGVDLSVPGVATHDWEVTCFLELWQNNGGKGSLLAGSGQLIKYIPLQVWVKNPHHDKIENFLEKVSQIFWWKMVSCSILKVVFTLHESFKDPKRTVTSPPYKIQEAGWVSVNIINFIIHI